MNRPRSGEFQRAVMAYGDDGLWDIVLGAILLFIGLVERLGAQPWWLAAVLLAIPGVPAAKRLICAPRLPAHETRQPASTGIRAAVWILSVATVLPVVASAGLVALAASGWSSEWTAAVLPIVLPILMALLGVVILVTVGTMLDAAGRYFFYAAVLAAGFLALLWPLVPDWLVLAAPGGVMLILGAGILLRFLRTHMRMARSQLRYRT